MKLMFVQLAHRSLEAALSPELPPLLSDRQNLYVESQRAKLAQALTLAIDAEVDVVIFPINSIHPLLYPVLDAYSGALHVIAPCGGIEAQSADVLTQIGLEHAEQTSISGELAIVADGAGAIHLRPLSYVDVRDDGALLRHVNTSEGVSLYDVYRQERLAVEGIAIREKILSFTVSAPNLGGASISLSRLNESAKTILLPSKLENIVIIDALEPHSILRWGTIVYGGLDPEIARMARDLNSSGVPRDLRVWQPDERRTYAGRSVQGPFLHARQNQASSEPAASDDSARQSPFAVWDSHLILDETVLHPIESAVWERLDAIDAHQMEVENERPFLLEAATLIRESLEQRLEKYVHAESGVDVFYLRIKDPGIEARDASVASHALSLQALSQLIDPRIGLTYRLLSTSNECNNS